MQNKGKTTIVQNILDDRSHIFCLPAQEAVVAAHELFDREDCNASSKDPVEHPEFRVHKRGFSCGDWFAYSPAGEDELDE